MIEKAIDVSDVQISSRAEALLLGDREKARGVLEAFVKWGSKGNWRNFRIYAPDLLTIKGRELVDMDSQSSVLIEATSPRGQTYQATMTIDNLALYNLQQAEYSDGLDAIDSNVKDDWGCL